MDILRRLLSFLYKSEEVNQINTKIAPVFYLGHTYTAQPTSDELRRAAGLLLSKNKGKLEKSLLPVLSLNFEDNNILLRNEKNDCCCSFDIKRIVFSCVDAKNQKLLAVFYHNNSPYIESSITVRGLECHLISCKTKEIARNAANKVGELLNKKMNCHNPRIHQVRQKHNIKTICEDQLYYDSYQYQTFPQQQTTQEQQPEQQGLLQFNSRKNLRNNRKRHSRNMLINEDIEYDDIYNFFRKDILTCSSNNSSIYSTPTDSLTTFLTTTGYDSPGRGSASPSIDMRHEELFSNRLDVSIPEMREDINDIPPSGNNDSENNPQNTQYNIDNDKKDSIDDNENNINNNILDNDIRNNDRKQEDNSSDDLVSDTQSNTLPGEVDLLPNQTIEDSIQLRSSYDNISSHQVGITSSVDHLSKNDSTISDYDTSECNLKVEELSKIPIMSETNL